MSVELLLRGSADPALARKVVDHLRECKGKPVEIVVRKPRSKRSLDQNAYAHKWPFRLIADAMGQGVEAAKLDILGAKWGWQESQFSGKPLPIKPNTSGLTVEEFSELIEWMPAWALETFGISIPLPSEVPD
jgi:hypothetical protein